MSSSANITVTVEDVNDNAPRFSGYKRLRRIRDGDSEDRVLQSLSGKDVTVVPVYEATMPSSASPGSEILRVYATDADEGQNGGVRFSIRNNAAGDDSFGIGERDGVIVYKKQRKNDLDNRFELYVLAHDLANPRSTRKNSIAVVVVEVKEEKSPVAGDLRGLERGIKDVKEQPRTVGTTGLGRQLEETPRRKKVAISEVTIYTTKKNHNYLR